MTLLLLLAGATALLLLIWAVCRTPGGPARDDETRKATQLADRNSAQAQFGGDAGLSRDGHSHHSPPYD